MRSFLLIITLFLLAGCARKQVIEREPMIHGPRWVDVDDWTQLKMGMAMDDVGKVLGEPFLPKRSHLEDGKNVQTIYWKMKPKYYTVRERSRIVTEKSGLISSDKEVSDWSGRDKKPDKKGEAIAWGDYFSLACIFVDSKLVEWYCPEIPEILSLEQEAKIIADSLKPFSTVQ